MKKEKTTDYLKLKPYEKKPFYAYPLFLLILVPTLIIPNDDVNHELLYNIVVLIAFATTIIITTISFWIIHKERVKEEEEDEEITIEVVIKKRATNVKVYYNDNKEEFQLETTTREDIIDEIKEKTKLTKEKIEKITRFKKEGIIDTKILSVLYGLVAALAITNALDIFIDGSNFGETDSLYEIINLVIDQEFIILISFFVVGTFFYHCGLAFFSDQAADMLHNQRHPAEIVSSGAILFTEGIFLYFAAGSIGSVLQFSLWIFFLMVVDLAWVLINSGYLKGGYAQWIHFDIIMIIFFLVFLLSYGDTELVQYHHYVIVFLVILYRIILDYKLSWKFFSKFSIVG